MSRTFAQLGVPESICRALEARGITEPFDIQAATLKDALAGRDVSGRAPTGSGKTLAFGIPVVANLERAESRRPRALVLAPTRELAEQIYTELKSFAKPVRIGVVYGGVGYGAQIRSLQQGIEVLVACPGRLEDLIQRGDVDLSHVERVVLDEADRMADMGFLPAVRRLLDQTRSKRQTVLFSATLDGDIAKLSAQYQTNPVRHEVGEETPDITTADHLFWKVDKSDRTGVTAEAVRVEWPAIIFCRTRHGCDRLTRQLSKLGIDAAAIHGGRNQNQRTRALADFASARVQALVATDVAARGIHVDGVTLVVHYDPPEDHKTYVHRSGRTARAGAGGVVVSLLQSDQFKDARRMQKKIGLSEDFTLPDPQILLDLASSEPKPDRPPVRVDEHHGSGRGGGGNRGGSSRGGSSRGGSNRGGSSRGGSNRGGSSNGSGSGRGRKGAKGSGGAKSNRSKAGSKSGDGSSQGAGSGGSSSGSKRRSNKKTSQSAMNRKARRAHLQTTNKSGSRS